MTPKDEDCAECLRLAEQEQAAMLTHDRSRLTDVRVMWHRHITEVHSEESVPAEGIRRHP